MLPENKPPTGFKPPHQWSNHPLTQPAQDR